MVGVAIVQVICKGADGYTEVCRDVGLVDLDNFGDAQLLRTIHYQQQALGAEDNKNERLEAPVVRMERS
jgi:hypothetical protein